MKIYSKLHDVDPTLRNKVIAISCDSSVAGLNICESDRQILKDEITVVIHGAASVRFNDPLSEAVLTNIRMTRDILVLATEMPKLQVLHYISTAYSNCHSSEAIAEKIYSPRMDWKTLLKIAENIPSVEVNAMEQKMIGASPNTYIFTKHIAESLVADFADTLPIVISRPVIVFPGWREPYPGWISNMNSPIAIMYATKKGVMRLFFGTGKHFAAYVNVDHVVNLIMLSSWRKSVENVRSSEISIYNTEYMKISERQMTTYNGTLNAIVPVKGGLWRPQMYPTKNRHLFLIGHLILHFLPGLLMDGILILTGSKPRLTRVYRSMYMTSLLLFPFVNREFDFITKNSKALSSFISEDDIKEFPIDLPIESNKLLKWDYMLDGMTGIRIFFGDPPKASSEDFTLQKRLYWLDITFKTLLLILLLWIFPHSFVWSFCSFVLGQMQSFLSLD